MGSNEHIFVVPLAEHELQSINNVAIANKSSIALVDVKVAQTHCLNVI